VGGSDVRAGEIAAFGNYYRWHYPRLVGFLQVLGAPVHQAADVAQQAMFELFRQWGHVTNRRAWTCSTASRLLAGPAVPWSPLVRAYDDVTWRAEHGIVGRVAALPPRQRHVLAWKLMEFAPAEIASELRISPEQVHSDLARARKALRPFIVGRAAGRLAAR
jgi:RNA polymerase sigma-70 factor (ECF subfamily)